VPSEVEAPGEAGVLGESEVPGEAVAAVELEATC